MTFWNYKAPTFQVSAIFKSANNIASTRSVNLDKTNLSVNSDGEYIYKAGMWLASVNGVDRFLPRAKVTSGIAASNTTQIPVDLPEVFKAGDSLSIIGSYNYYTFSGTWAADDTVLVSIPEYGFTYTITVTTATLAEVTAEVAAALNATEFNKSISFVSDGADLIVFTPDLPLSGLTLTETTAGDGAIGTVNVGAKTVGTIASIDHASSTLVLNANNAVRLPLGVTVETPFQRVYGLHPHVIDMTQRTTVAVNAVHGADAIYRVALPYTDSLVESLFPALNIE